MAGRIMRRNTRQRQLVLEELRKVTSHPTAPELYELARVQMPRISLGTVYRNLELLAAAGQVLKLESSGGGESRFDGNVKPHSHVRCTRCGHVDDAHGIDLEIDLASFTSIGGYDIIGHHLEFIGICPACRRAAGEPDESTVCDADRRNMDEE